MRIENEFEAARLETRPRPLQAQQQFLKVLITVAYRHTVPAAYRVRDCGPQTESLEKLEDEAETVASASRWSAHHWLEETFYSAMHGIDELTNLLNGTMSEHLIGKESGEGLVREFKAWLKAFGNIHFHVFNICDDIDKAGLAFRKQLLADKRVSDVKRFLPSLQTASTRSVGVMLDTDIHVHFGGMVKEFKALYMQIIQANPLKAYQDAIEFVQKWSRVHNELLKMLMLKDTFHVGAPSIDEIQAILAMRGYDLSTPPMDGTSNSGVNQSSNLCAIKPGWKTDTKPSPQNQSDIASSKSVPGTTNPDPRGQMSLLKNQY